MNLQTINASASPEVQENENFETLDGYAVYGKRQPVTLGLTWGYYGGRFGGNTVANGTLTLTNTTDNYVVVERSSGAITVSTATTNWNNGAAYCRAYKITCAGGVVTATEDHRLGPYGLASLGDSTSAGRQHLYIPIALIIPSATAGCSSVSSTATSSNHPDLRYSNFVNTSQTYGQFSIAMPKRWDKGTVTFQALWSHSATTVNFGVVWDLQGVAVSDDDTIDVAYGTAQTSTDTGGTTSDLYISPESAAITIAGTPANGDLVFFRLSRVTGDAADDMAVSARLHGINVYYTSDAENDA